MLIWFIVLITVTIFCLLSQLKRTPRGTWIVVSKSNRIWVFLGCSILVLMSGLRSFSGIGDTEAYVGYFNDIPKDFEGIRERLETEGEWGFTLFQFIIKQITDNPQCYLLIVSILILVPIFFVYYKYSNSFALAIFVFVAGGNFLVTMNGIRQYLVSAALFLVFPLIYYRKWWLYFPIVLLLSTIHNSCLIFIILYFVVNHKAWGKISKGIIVIGTFLYIVRPVAQRLALLLLQNSQYDGYSQGISAGNNGSNIIRSLIYLVPIILAYFYDKDIRKENQYYDIVFNMSILNCIFSFLSNSISWIFARYSIYFSLYSILLLCWGIRAVPNRNNRTLIYLAAFGFYFIFYFYEMVLSLGQVYTSNYF